MFKTLTIFQSLQNRNRPDSRVRERTKENKHT